MKNLDIIRESIRKHQEERRYLYCVVSEITGLSYNQSKNLLHDFCNLGIIKCDSNFYSGFFVND